MVLPHLGAAAGEARGGDDAVGPEQFAAEQMITFRIELGISQHATNGNLTLRFEHQRPQGGAIVPGICRACWARMTWRSTSTTVSHFSQCFQERSLSPKCSILRMK
jgi:hypothetical protein